MMETVIKKILYKGDGKNIFVAIRPGLATIGSVLVNIGEMDEEIDITRMPIDGLSKIPQKVYAVKDQVSFLAKLSPAPGKNVVRLEYVFVENGKVILTEVIEKNIQTFERYSNIYLLEKEPPQPVKKP